MANHRLPAQQSRFEGALFTSDCQERSCQIIVPRRLPPEACWDDPVENLEPAVDEQAVSHALASETLSRLLDWVLRGEVEQRSLRFHLMVLRFCPHLLPCQHPSANWCALQHGVSRQWACRLKQELIHELGDRLRFRRQRFHRRAKGSA